MMVRRTDWLLAAGFSAAVIAFLICLMATVFLTQTSSYERDTATAASQTIFPRRASAGATDPTAHARVIKGRASLLILLHALDRVKSVGKARVEP